jgi:hypothetical protein
MKNRYCSNNGDLVCGDNPDLTARIVENVHVEHKNHRTQKLHWTVPEWKRFDSRKKSGVIVRTQSAGSFMVKYTW